MTMSSSSQTGAVSYQSGEEQTAETAETARPAKPAARAQTKARGSRKSASAFRTISEVSDELDVPQHVLRFWETKFSQLRPMKRGGGRRYYRPEDVQLLREIKTLLHRDCYTIKGVQKLLKERRAGEPIVELESGNGSAEKAAARAVASGVTASGAELDPALRETLGALLKELRELRKAMAGEGG